MTLTKVKIRRCLHLVGLLIGIVACAWVWLTEDLTLPASVKIGATIVLLTTLFTKWDEVVLPRAMRYVDSLSIPETETETETTTTTTRTTTCTAKPPSTFEDDNGSNIPTGKPA